MAGVVIVGKGVVTGAEVAAVTCADARVVVDPATDLTANAVESEAAFTLTVNSALSRSLEHKATRAALFGTLAYLARSSTGVRQVVADALATMLNDGPLPAIPIADAVMGIAAAVQDAVGGLQSHELSALTTGNPAAAGIAAVSTFAARSLAQVADGVAALSAESLCAPAEFFEADASKTRPHPGLVRSTNVMYRLTAGSTQVVPGGSSSAPSAGAGAAAAAAPASDDRLTALATSMAFHGAAHDAIAHAYRTTMTEFNASPAVDKDGGVKRPVHPQLLYAAMLDTQSAVYTLARASVGRTPIATDNIAWMANPNMVSGNAVLYAHALFEVVEATSQRLAAEWRASLASLAEREAAWKKAADAADAKRAAAMAKMAEKEAKMTPEQRAVAEKKAAKRAGKKKAQTKSVKGERIGNGNRDFRGFVDGEGGGADAALCGTDPACWEAQAFLTRLVDNLESGGARRVPTIARGAQDFHPDQMTLRHACFSKIRSVFLRHGGVEIDTPVFELRETLTGKYGEDGGKLIFDLADQGGELLSLRYDLTVPFARYLATHGDKTTNIKRFHIARVYRRDAPQPTRGRFREFYQCDFDIAGDYSSAPMMPDAQVLKVACDVLSALDVGTFQLKFNHRVLLDAIMELAGVPAKKFRTICSAIDKLDKEEWSEVRREMTEDKGLPGESADTIGEFVKIHGEAFTVLDTLEGGPLGGHAGAAAALKDLRSLFTYLEAMGCLQFVSFDMSLARGLDYYTGAIYEAVVLDSELGVGSIAAGGRYDNLVGMFSPHQIPCVGVSIGVERVFAILEERARRAQDVPQSTVDVLIASATEDLTVERMRVANQLWQAGIACSFVYKRNPKMVAQTTEAAKGNIPFMIVIGRRELDAGVVSLKTLATREQEEVPVAELVGALRAKLAALGRGASAVAAVAPAAVAGAGTSRGSNPDMVKVEGCFTRPTESIL